MIRWRQRGSRASSAARRARSRRAPSSAARSSPCRRQHQPPGHVDLGSARGTSGTSSAEEVAEILPADTPVVEAFDTTFAGTLLAGEVAGHELDILIAGDDEAAKEKVAQLASDGGLRSIDAGPLARAQQVEQLGLLHISLQQPHELGFASTIKLHP